MTTIKQCTCENKFQDDKYGKHMRIFNMGTKGDAKCTVCGNKTKIK